MVAGTDQLFLAQFPGAIYALYRPLVFSAVNRILQLDEKLNKILIYNTHFKKKHYRMCDHSFLEGTTDFYFQSDEYFLKIEYFEYCTSRN